MMIDDAFCWNLKFEIWNYYYLLLLIFCPSIMISPSPFHSISVLAASLYCLTKLHTRTQWCLLSRHARGEVLLRPQPISLPHRLHHQFPVIVFPWIDCTCYIYSSSSSSSSCWRIIIIVGDHHHRRTGGFIPCTGALFKSTFMMFPEWMCPGEPSVDQDTLFTAAWLDTRGYHIIAFSDARPISHRAHAMPRIKKKKRCHRLEFPTPPLHKISGLWRAKGKGAVLFPIENLHR